jgi:glycosyltransferase involved in cell wall biosynthesis
MSVEFELVLPCYNESKSLKNIILRARSAALQAGLNAKQFQLVLVENGSKDDSKIVLESLLKESDLQSWFRTVSVHPNQGYGHGLQQGLNSTTAPYIGWSHADQQCDPADAFKALKMLKESRNPEKTIIKGVRKGRSIKEQMVSRVFELVAWKTLGYRFYEINAQPKVFHRKLLSFSPNPPKDFAFDVYMLFKALKNHYEIATFEVDFPPRVHGFSNWANGLKNRSHHIKNMIRYMQSLAQAEGKIK